MPTTFDELLAAGPVVRSTRETAKTLSRAVARGAAVSLLPGVFAPAHLAEDFAVRLAAVPAWRSDAVICGAAAARLSFWPELRVVDIDVAAPSRVARRGYAVSRVVVPPDHVQRRGDLAVMAPALTAVDLAGRRGPDAIDRALRSRLITLDQLWEAFACWPGRPGNRARRRHLIRSRSHPWSAAERLAHAVLDDSGLRGWVANRPTWTSTGEKFYPDIAFLAVRLAIEIDGRFHHDDPDVFENDRRRHNALVNDGWTVLRFTYRQLVDDPAGVVATIRTALRRLGA